MFLRFVLPWAFIACVVGIDIHLTIRHSFIMEQVEINPIGKRLLKEPDGVALLASMKAVGLGVALLFIFSIWQFKRFQRAATFASYSVACMHVALLAIFCNDGIRNDNLAIDRQLKLENAKQFAEYQDAKLKSIQHIRRTDTTPVQTTALAQPATKPVSNSTQSFPNTSPIPPREPERRIGTSRGIPVSSSNLLQREALME